MRALGDEDQRVLIVLALTLATGVVDAVSYFSLDHVFTANMSGNMALLGIGTATSLHAVTGNVYAFFGFVIGSVAVARFLRTRSGSSLRIAGLALGLQLVLLIALTLLVAVIDVHVRDGWRYAVCAILAVAMAIQTGIARHLAVQDVNTTVATMTLHDLAAASRAAGGDSVRWRRRAGVVIALFVGAACGTALDQAVRWGGLALSSAIVAFVLVVTMTLAADDDRPTTPTGDDAPGRAGGLELQPSPVGARR
ncbi:YoaK family protein [Baekduia alba]|uniref:YoaK family protein n=1 Tax=Baekduia alba TaxID=2997333 RepID=UPI00233F9ECD|nr:YoaK family protein [Baekduia alba]